MSKKTSGHFATAIEWAKHLRPYGKRLFWSSERAKARRYLDGQTGREGELAQNRKLNGVPE